MMNSSNKELYPSNRGNKQNIRKSNKRKLSSTNWIKRQINDPYVIEAKKLGYNSRAAFKLLQIDNKFGFLKPSKKVIDLGCAPGGWLQVASQKVRSNEKHRNVVGVDLLPVENIPGTKTFVGDINDPKIDKILIDSLGDYPDIILSDMAANVIGHKQTDHLRTTQLIEIALDFTLKNLKKNGIFLVKTFKGGTETELLNIMKNNFKYVKNIKPLASRPESVESYTICLELKA
ncbi:MAG: 23S rRNA methyltransferase [SAR116 cluster bacterium]|nr:23S rRNA methyltransferase [SAR116 cluster bacterium]RPH09042.1 MAG: RlmE family RNA methyltransferase [Alphaproteobacteria bacterium TMED54]